MEDKIKLLETFENEFPNRDYTIIHTAPEFTSLCPKTGQPDFATIEIDYIPDKLCIELKSLKLYLNSYRNDGVFFESVTNRILEDLVEVCSPRYMLVTAEFNVRGGISSVVEAEYESEDIWGDETFN
ncbi:MAG: NADPH-dependent 7-cyano-7-deazaguanine reductase QueF [Bacteroidetes bacterium]|nr:NADPH-dependent 7-cyano-7-deazaguanine reductase QueF [Bacteroidota bacterium]MCH8032614.1 NADPH-dependent 7-cyano-7-deazaguanine reductase QueF [Bacteroidota bacterium]